MSRLLEMLPAPAECPLVLATLLKSCDVRSEEFLFTALLICPDMFGTWATEPPIVCGLLLLLKFSKAFFDAGLYYL